MIIYVLLANVYCTFCGYFSRFLIVIFLALAKRLAVGWREHLWNDLFCVEWDV